MASIGNHIILIFSRPLAGIVCVCLLLFSMISVSQATPLLLIKNSGSGHYSTLMMQHQAVMGHSDHSSVTDQSHASEMTRAQGCEESHCGEIEDCQNICVHCSTCASANSFTSDNGEPERAYLSQRDLRPASSAKLIQRFEQPLHRPPITERYFLDASTVVSIVARAGRRTG